MNDDLEAWRDELVGLRRDIHMHPELAFEEVRTAGIVADELARYGLEVHRGLAKTGVVGTLGAGASGRAIALRADMDALPIEEANDFAHRSVHEGRMHACGHDGHTAMLLGAARCLARTRGFDGTVHFVFQPAEEAAGGARAMIEDGLFEKFPVEAIYGMHNAPGLPVGSFATRVGPLLAASDSFEAVITGTGTHAAMPQLGVDPIVVGAETVLALQSVVARTLDPLESAVVSVTQFQGGDAWNVIPETVRLRGCTRSFKEEVQDQLEAAMARVIEGVARAHGARAEFRYSRDYPALVNTEAETEAAAGAARDVTEAENVITDFPPLMASEDFSFMLEQRPGSYVLIGNGDGEGTCMVHNPGYDFNDDILILGARYWTRLVERELAA